jgi:hypothetical protein
MQINQQNYVNILEANEFICSELINSFQLNIKDIFIQLEELFKKIKSKFINILVISNGNYAKTDDSYINEIISKISKNKSINLKVVKLNILQNNVNFNFFLKLNNYKNENNNIIELTKKSSGENIYKELYDFYDYKNLKSGWKIIRRGNKILKLPFNSTKEIQNSNEEIFFANFNDFISSISQRVAINKIINFL